MAGKPRQVSKRQLKGMGLGLEEGRHVREVSTRREWQVGRERDVNTERKKTGCRHALYEFVAHALRHDEVGR